MGDDNGPGKGYTGAFLSTVRDISKEQCGSTPSAIG